MHVTQVFSLPSGDPSELADLPDDEMARLRRSQRFIRDKGAYLQLQATQPQTLAHALVDSPVGQHNYPRGGHHPARQVPDLLADDLRRFFLSTPAARR